MHHQNGSCQANIDRTALTALKVLAPPPADAATLRRLLAGASATVAETARGISAAHAGNAGAFRVRWVGGRGGRFHADWEKVGETVISSRPVRRVKDFASDQWKLPPAVRACVGVVFCAGLAGIAKNAPNPRLAAFVPFAEFPAFPKLRPCNVCWGLFFFERHPGEILRLQFGVKGGNGLIIGFAVVVKALLLPGVTVDLQA